MCVANGDWSSSTCSRFTVSSKPSNRRFPPPRMTGAIEIESSSTCPARSAWRITSAPDAHVLPARRLARSGDRLVQAVHERGSAARVTQRGETRRTRSRAEEASEVGRGRLAPGSAPSSYAARWPVRFVWSRQALDVDVRVSRGGTMEESSAGAVLEHITQILEDSLTPSGMDQWLRSRNRMLGGGRRLDLLDEGDAARVQEAARAFADGAYV